MFVSVCVCVWVCAYEGRCPQKPEVLDPSRFRVPDGCQHPYEATGIGI